MGAPGRPRGWSIRLVVLAQVMNLRVMESSPDLGFELTGKSAESA